MWTAFFSTKYSKSNLVMNFLPTAKNAEKQEEEMALKIRNIIFPIFKNAC